VYLIYLAFNLHIDIYEQLISQAMKRTLLVLAMLLTAATSYNQSTRRTNNAEQTAPREKRQTTETRSKPKTTNDQKSSDEIRSSERKQDPKSVNRGSRTNTTTTRESSREDNSNNKPVNNYNSSTRTHTNSSERNDDRNVRTNNNDENKTVIHRETNTVVRQTTSRSADRKAYTAPVTDYYSPRVYRDHHSAVHSYHRPPESKEYRVQHYVYRPPVNVNVYWTHDLHTRYVEIYPMVKQWYYPIGFRIETISAYDAEYYLGEVINVYGRITEVFYSRETDEYFLYFGPYYPYQDFTVVVPGGIARYYSSRPSRFFRNQNVLATGLITSFEGNPEMVVRDPNQFNIY
jgi:hypothetical protein